MFVYTYIHIYIYTHTDTHVHLISPAKKLKPEKVELVVGKSSSGKPRVWRKLLLLLTGA